MSRSFSTTMRALLDIVWKNTQAKPDYDAMITRSIEAHPKLSQSAKRVEVAGDEHASKADTDLRVSGQIYSKEGMRITSGHWWRWLPPQYVAIKVNANNYASQESAEKELHITEHITKANPQHPGRNFVAVLLDSFRVASPSGTHICMVFDALCEPLWMLKHRFEGEKIPLDVLKPVSKLILEGLRYLHTECHVIHTDLKSDNILLALRNPSILDSVAQDEMNNPSPRKQLDGRDIYLSRNYWGLSPNELGRSVITDFGLAVRGDGPPNSHPIQPEGYRAPEVCLRADWSYSVDIWNLGVMIWDLFYGHGPFDIAPNARGSASADEAHLGQVISLLGPPPPDLLNQGKEASRYFDAKGQFKFPELIRKKDIVSMAKEIDNYDGIPQFVDFVSGMLRWRPEDRTTAEDLLSHPWLLQTKPVNG
ncbi:protein kinase [Penicillium chermesinum]|uniref:non-specific serine/threonine protein kinase n=1 Tax=Penicillium chermesinum TaxID=63820 RepID=A0A9W9NZF0_9EURO|nr:protein kinase [Penicillium chermesinum]KAJ5232547.1 protein kinase [Penicillium chermesinum]KAJ6172204.1 protein kinase [Penicillium chermesinum]